MRFLSVLIFFIGAISFSWAQTSPPPPSASSPTNATTQAAATNHPEVAILQQLSEKIDKLEAKSEDTSQTDKLKAELFVAQSKLDEVRKSESDSRSTLYTVLIVVVALAALSIIGLVAFCFYTMRRVTEMGAPLLDSLHAQRHPALPYGSPMGVLPPATNPADPHASTGVAVAGEGRLLDAVGRLERKIEEIERAAHLDGHAHVNVTPPNGSEFNVRHDRHHADRFVLLMNKGEAHTNLQQFDRAIECFDQAVLLAPNDPSPLVKKGYAMEKLGSLDAAVSCYDRALELDPTYSMAYLFKGGVCNRLQKYAEAIECYDRALAMGTNER